MTDTQRSMITAGLVCGAAASVVGGIAVRERVDLGALKLASAPSSVKIGSGLLASRTVETQIPEGEYFDQMAHLLKREYVDPIKDDLKLATGAVRGMVGSLDDVRSVFYDPKLMRSVENARKGRYEGIGADFVFVRAKGQAASPGGIPMGGGGAAARSELVPRLVASWVVPGGPADRAGVKAGDWVDSVDGHWVVNTEVIDRIRTASQRVQSGEWPESKLRELRKELREMLDSAIMPYRAMERLSLGETGQVKVVWKRPSGVKTTVIQKSATAARAVEETSPGVFRLRLVPGADQSLSNAARGRKEMTLDLRGQAIGDRRDVVLCLTAIGPAGKYGQIKREGGKPASPLQTEKGAAPPKLTILVDGQTRGAPEALALALKAKCGAKVAGQSAGDPFLTELRSLPDGSGYRLVTGTFSPTAPAKGGKSK